MLVIPAQIWLAIAEVAGAAVLSAWRRIVLPGLGAVGTDAYSGDLAAVAPAPEVNRQQAGDAHLWAFVPLAGAALVGLVLALTGRPRAARLLIAVGSRRS
jgi:hypothetical protein